MYRAVHIRNLVVALAVIVAIMLASGAFGPGGDGSVGVLAAPQQGQGAIGLQVASAQLSATVSAQSDTPGAQVDYTLTLRNVGDVSDTFQISFPQSCNTGITGCTESSNLILITLAAAQSASFTVSVFIPASATPGSVGQTVVRATPQTPGGGTSQITLTTTVVAAPTNTPTSTPTLTPTPTVGPTATPAPVCSGGVEANDPGDTFGAAQLILVDVATQRGICRIGDLDWFKFGGVGGKVYTIDITQMAAGLDLSIDLYDDQGNRLTSNDDFFRRDPSKPDPKDIKPRIQSWRAPRDGMYYFLVRDTLNLGGGDRSYTVIVNSESYGPTPVTIPEICRDLFEEDGLPEQATLLTSNELQPAHLLCPTGDADWVRFFGSAGKTYYLYTDTRPYANKPDLNSQTEAGADTVLYLADRDGVSIIDFNDDLQGGGSLDSEIRFTPQVDGFYYAQVKNVGDIGNQFIYYDLVLKLCVPGQECGRSPATTSSSGSGSGSSSATTTAGFDPNATETPTPTPTSGSGTFLQNTLKPGPMVNGPLRGFADRSFEQVWQRNDQPIAQQRTARSWTWGPRGLMARTEGYLQSASGLRQVQYFDKARMEVNNPNGDRGSRWFVTTGLLVVELTSGNVQIGNNEFVRRAPADIPIAGDPDDASAPTYASFAGVTGLAPGDRSGQIVAESIDRAGTVAAYAGPQRPETRLAHFVAETGHNIPQVFWDYLNASGTVYEGGRYRDATLVDWVFTLGYPISEPYWTHIRVGGAERDVLVQAFQRRVLTYSPDNPRGWQVEMGNVGRHYYLWRYGQNLPDQ